MKKIISLLLTMLLVLVPAAIAGAEEAQVDVTVDITVYTLDVSVKTDITGGLTLKVYPLKDGEVAKGTMPIYLGECTTPVAEGTQYVYTFDSFNVLKSTKTGEYRIVINNTYTHDFDFVNKNDKIAFYNTLASASDSAIEGILEAAVEEGVVDFDLGEYFDYSDEVKDEINACLAELELPALGNDPSDEAIAAFEETLKPEVARLLAVAEFFLTEVEDFEAAVAEYADELGLDLEFYADEDLEMDPADVYDRLHGLNNVGYSADEVSDAFDLASLLVMLDYADYGAVTEALQYYDGGVIDLDTDLTEDFTEAKLNKVSQSMKKEASSYNSAADIEEGYKEAAEAILDSETSSSGGSSSGGGASSGGGSSMGGGSKRPVGTGSSKVETPVEDKVVVNFSDLSDAAWATEAIKALAEDGIVSGKGDGKFYPNDTVTREEFVKIIVEALDIYNKNAVASFDDVQDSRWSYGYIASAVHAGIIKGVSDTEFNPAGTMSRQDMAVIMYRVAGLLGLDVAGDSSVFADNADIAEYAKEAVGALSGAGIINGTGNDCFSPKGTVTRAQAAKVVYEVMNAVGGAK